MVAGKRMPKLFWPVSGDAREVAANAVVEKTGIAALCHRGVAGQGKFIQSVGKMTQRMLFGTVHGKSAEDIFGSER
ncbi:MAG: hypothetical protein EOO77_38335 [Oxalobacteraceae bacterium]|nr:MAG: hypothetical protein EOO77_38335 [Oxalobacteraceae bacterium]